MSDRASDTMHETRARIKETYTRLKAKSANIKEKYWKERVGR
jgi:hypothetical protein